MQFTEEVSWGVLDVVFDGIILLVIGLIGDLILRKITNTKYKLLVLITFGLILILTWAELAVGIFNSPFAGN